jgi:YegS/Rv2252/BmrU family lipid kinase
MPEPGRLPNAPETFRVIIILNGLSLKLKKFYRDMLPVLQARYRVEVWKTLSKNDAVDLAAKATAQQANVIIAAGGDGTLHQVLNGMLQGNGQGTRLPVMALLPLGSGNDFARTVNITPDVHALIRLLDAFQPKRVDVGRIQFFDTAQPERYFINIADIGMGPDVVKRVLQSGRPFGSTVAYYSAIIKTFFSYRLQSVEVKADSWNWQGPVRTLAVANGRYFGDGLCVAPEASLTDGQFSCFIGGKVSLLDFILQTGNLRAARKIQHPHVMYRTASFVELHAPHTMAIEADGEWIGTLPVRIDMQKERIQFLY